MHEEDRQLIIDLKSRISPNIKQKVKKLILYGSRARGDARDDSDLDIVALVDENTLDLERELDDSLAFMKLYLRNLPWRFQLQCSCK